MQIPEISNDILGKVIENIHSWKSPDSDSIHNYRYKKLTCLHPYLLKCINNFDKRRKIRIFITR